MGRPMALPPGEPPAGPWTAVAATELAERLLRGAAQVRGRPWVVAIDGRAGAGKTTMADLLYPLVRPAAVLHTDDLAWHEPHFGWGHLLTHVLQQVHSGQAVSFQPPAWRARGRQGSIDVPAGLATLLVEGTGASQRDCAPLIDRAIWVQADHDLATRRGIARDVVDGSDGDETQVRMFWQEWLAHEMPFLADQRPWERADVIVAGTPVIESDDGDLAWAPPPG